MIAKFLLCSGLVLLLLSSCTSTPPGSKVTVTPLSTSTPTQPGAQPSTPAPAEVQVAQGSRELPTVISVGDGDTLRISLEGEAVTVRLTCVDAPELAQSPWGSDAATRLAELLPPGQAVQVREVGTDRYGRTVAELFLGNESVNLRLVEEGLAVVYPEYLNNCLETRDRYLQAEANARTLKLGLWEQNSPVMPWDFRSGETVVPSLETVIEPIASPTSVVSEFPMCVQSDCDCGNFATQAEAQGVLNAFSGDPHRLDGDQDGIACESLP